jgi:uncharacterized protein (TIGR02996 family)
VGFFLRPYIPAIVTDREALLRAICEYPDDDTPRLIYADFLEESGEADLAGFIRAQVQLARTPPWEPFAVLCRYRNKEWSDEGLPFRPSLPTIHPRMGVEWHPQSFRRGLGWRIKIADLNGWKQVWPWLFEQAPIGEVDLVAPATLEDWKEFAQGPWLSRIRVIHLDGTSPVEPIRALCESQHLTGVTDIYFHRASSPGLPELVEDLLQSPLGRNLKGLHFRVGHESVGEVLAILATSGIQLERLSLDTMGVSPEMLHILLHTRFASGLKELDLSRNRLGIDSDSAYCDWPLELPSGLEVLRVTDCSLNRVVIESLSHHKGLPHLRHLDLSRNPAVNNYPAVFDRFPTGRLLELRRCRPSENTLDCLVSSRMWSNLVGLDLRENFEVNSGGGLLEASLGPGLTAIVMDDMFDPSNMNALRSHFGERLVIDSEFK